MNAPTSPTQKKARALALVLALSGLLAFAASAAAQDEQSVVIHLSNFTNDLHAPFMALKIGTMIAEGGAEVTLFVDLEGVRLVDAETPNELTWGINDMTLAQVYDGFVAAGGKVLVCPHCAEVAGVETLRKGATLGDADKIAALFLTADKVIDY